MSVHANKTSDDVLSFNITEICAISHCRIAQGSHTRSGLICRYNIDIRHTVLKITVAGARKTTGFSAGFNRPFQIKVFNYSIAAKFSEKSGI